MTPNQIIAAIRIGIKHAEHRFKNGGCFQLYRVLKQLYPQAVPWYAFGHVYTEIDGTWYDIDGSKPQAPEGAMLLAPETMLHAKAHGWDFESQFTYSNSPKAPESSMKILHATIHRQWFLKIASGEKPEDYREIKDSWTKKLEGKSYDAVRFRNGYQKDAPIITLVFNGYRKGIGNPNWGAPLNETVYILELGEILEIINLDKASVNG